MQSSSLDQTTIIKYFIKQTVFRRKFSNRATFDFLLQAYAPFTCDISNDSTSVLLKPLDIVRLGVQVLDPVGEHLCDELQAGPGQGPTVPRQPGKQESIKLWYHSVSLDIIYQV